MDNFDLRQFLYNNPLLKENKNDIIYDLGGADYPFDEDNPNSIVVDIKPSSSFNYENKYIQADLNKYLKLPSVKKIYTSKMIKYLNFNSISNLAKTINDGLLSGGKLVIEADGDTPNNKPWEFNKKLDWKDYILMSKDLLNDKELLNILMSKYGFKLIKWDLDGDAEEGYIQLTFTLKK